MAAVRAPGGAGIPSSGLRGPRELAFRSGRRSRPRPQSQRAAPLRPVQALAGRGCERASRSGAVGSRRRGVRPRGHHRDIGDLHLGGAALGRRQEPAARRWRGAVDPVLRTRGPRCLQRELRIFTGRRLHGLAAQPAGSSARPTAPGCRGSAGFRHPGSPKGGSELSQLGVFALHGNQQVEVRLRLQDLRLEVDAAIRSLDRSRVRSGSSMRRRGSSTYASPVDWMQSITGSTTAYSAEHRALPASPGRPASRVAMSASRRRTACDDA
jgi:hypothetical protein